MTVVFDNYSGTPSTKDHTHIRRTSGVQGPAVDFMQKTVFSSNKNTFLSNHMNKQRFINMLATKLIESDILVEHSSGDADYLIALTAIEKVRESNVVCVTDDTDILVLLLHYAKKNQFNLHLKASSSSATRPQWDIFETQGVLGSPVISHILFIHAFLGCDTVSSIFLKGKTALLNKIDQIKNFASCFYEDVPASDIADMGEKVMLVLYGNKHYDTLNEFRMFQYNLKVATSKNVVQAKSLPPTYNGAAQHSFRVYHQVQSWLGNEKDPLQWGWKLKFGKLWPITMTQPAAPDSLLRFLRCACKSDCTRSTCSCRKYNMTCSTICTHCKGISCFNVDHDIDESTD